jgi:hypothetical protein
MSTKKTLTITALVFVAGMSGIVVGLSSIPQVDAATDEPSDWGRCQQATNAFDLFYGLESGKGLAEHRQEFCTQNYPHLP